MPEQQVDLVDTVDRLVHMDFFEDYGRVLDLGCGAANWGVTLCHNEIPVLSYDGIDCCNQNIMIGSSKLHRYRTSVIPFKRIQFMDIHNAIYNPNGTIQPEKVILPFDDNYFYTVICHSLFTHLGTEAIALRYMKEIRRVMLKGGKLWITFFTSPPNEVAQSDIRTVYTQEFIDKLLEGFHITSVSGGTTTDFHDQKEYACEYLY